MTPTLTEYADAIREAREWLVGESDTGIAACPAEELFVSWYGHVARQYTIETAWDFYWGHAGPAVLELREGEGSVPGAGVQRERDVHPTDEPGREDIPAPGSRSIPKGVIVWS